MEVQTNASLIGLGAVLLPGNPHGHNIVANARRNLSDVEREYPSNELVYLAVV